MKYEIIRVMGGENGTSYSNPLPCGSPAELMRFLDILTEGSYQIEGLIVANVIVQYGLHDAYTMESIRDE